MPVITHILETALYVDDLDAVVAFTRISSAFVYSSGPRLVSLDAGSDLLSSFARALRSRMDTPNGRIPPHDGQGPCTGLPSPPGLGMGAPLQTRRTIESRVLWDRVGRVLRRTRRSVVELATLVRGDLSGVGQLILLSRPQDNTPSGASDRPRRRSCAILSNGLGLTKFDHLGTRGSTA